MTASGHGPALLSTEANDRCGSKAAVGGRAGERRLWHLCDACSAPDLSWHWADHGHAAGAVLFRVFASLGGNRFDQARVVIPDVADP
jgi:hypothetical protein